MNHLDLCSGIGGFALAARWAGWQTVGFCEIDKFCQKVLVKNFPDVPIFEDIHDVTAKSISTRGIERADILTAGFPCQPFSVAGKQLAEKDNRHLWPQVLRVVTELKPRWIVGENVAGIINLALDDCIASLEGEGYEVQAFVIPACAVGALHRRDRVWIVAHSGGNCSGSVWSAGHDLSNWREAATDYKKRDQEQFGVGAVCASTADSISDGRRQNGQGKSGGLVVESEPFFTNTINERSHSRRRWNKELDQVANGQCQKNGHSIEEYSSDAGNTTGAGLPDWSGGEIGQPQPLTEFERPGSGEKQREIERNFRGMANGVSRRVDRLRALGNAIVPQVVFEIFKAIAAVE